MVKLKVSGDSSLAAILRAYATERFNFIIEMIDFIEESVPAQQHNTFLQEHNMPRFELPHIAMQYTAVILTDLQFIIIIAPTGN